MATDTFKHNTISLDSPAHHADAIVPDDQTDMAFTSRALFVGQGGDLTVHMVGKTEPITFRNLPVCLLPIRVDRVLATGTTVTDIVALW